MAVDKKNTLDTENGGRKFDGDKVDWSLLPFEALEGVLERFTLGAKKYDRWNYLKVSNAKERYFSAGMRHLTAYWKGDEIDDDPNFQNTNRGKYHLSAALWNFMVLEYIDILEKKGIDLAEEMNKKH